MTSWLGKIVIKMSLDSAADALMRFSSLSHSMSGRWLIHWLGLSIKISNWHAKKGVVQRRSNIDAHSYFNTVRGSMNCKSGEPLMKNRRSWT